MPQSVLHWSARDRSIVVSARREVRSVTMVVVVRANLLNQFVIGTVERYEDADHFERL